MDDVRAVMDAVGLRARGALRRLRGRADVRAVRRDAIPSATSALVLYGAMARDDRGARLPVGAAAEALRRVLAEFIADRLGRAVAGCDGCAPSRAGRSERFRRVAGAATSASAPARRRSRALSDEHWTSTSAPSCRRSASRRSSCTGAATGRHRSTRAATWPSGSRAPASSSCRATTTCRGSGDADAVLDEIEEFLTGARHGAEPDRVLATVLFTDIVGSTERAAELGDRALARAARRATTRPSGASSSASAGARSTPPGDGFLATFDGPARAIRCAQAIGQAVRCRRVGGIRAGLHTGEIELMGDDVGGIAVHIAARVAALAGPGEVLVSSTVKDLVAGLGLATSRTAGAHALEAIATSGGCSRARAGLGREHPWPPDPAPLVPPGARRGLRQHHGGHQRAGRSEAAPTAKARSKPSVSACAVRRHARAVRADRRDRAEARRGRARRRSGARC